MIVTGLFWHIGYIKIDFLFAPKYISKYLITSKQNRCHSMTFANFQMGKKMDNFHEYSFVYPFYFPDNGIFQRWICFAAEYVHHYENNCFERKLLWQQGKRKKNYPSRACHEETAFSREQNFKRFKSINVIQRNTIWYFVRLKFVVSKLSVHYYVLESNIQTVQLFSIKLLP